MSDPAATSHTDRYFSETIEIASAIDRQEIDNLCQELVALREREGRLFVLGVGGGAGNAGHAVNDFRKLCGIEAYAPTDNVSELTARTNDEGWESVFKAWLEGSRAAKGDAVFVFSVGGGNLEQNVSPNIVHALDLAKSRGLRVLGIVGRDGGYTKRVGHAVVVVPTIDDHRVTPHTEGFQAVVWHCLVCDPRLQSNRTKW